MDASKKVALSAAVTLAVVMGVIAFDEPVKSESAIESKVAWREDGTKVYLIPVELKDGTQSFKETTEAPCKRRPKGVDGSLCQRTSITIQGKTRTDPAPLWGRFAAADMIGPGCEPVACSVTDVETSNSEEKPAKAGR